MNLLICRTRSRAALAAALSGLTTFAAGAVYAHGDAVEETVTPLMKQAIPEISGKNVLIATVDFAPSQASTAHRHPGSLFAYVLEGTVESQLAGAPLESYKQGESWYEPPGASHLIARNPSKSKPARLLIFTFAAEGEPVKLPLK
jgi:quercetin dioxygenase-like cupin family protein